METPIKSSLGKYGHSQIHAPHQNWLDVCCLLNI